MKTPLIKKLTAITLAASMLTAGAALLAAADRAVPTAVTVSAAGGARAVAAPARVTLKTGYSCTSTAIRINWYQAKNASGYRIYRYNASTKKWVNIKTVSGGSTLTYRDANLTPNTTYQYKVKAYRKSGGKTYWGTASSVLAAKTKSAAPAKVTVTSYTSTATSITLNWNKVSGASGYRVYRYDPKTKAYVNIKTVSGGSTVTYTDKSLAHDTTYKYKVKAYTKLGGKTYWGVASNILTAATQHVHSWKNVYRTEDVYETRPVYENKPVYEDRPVYDETPIYEQHKFCNCSNRDMTAEYAEYQANGGTYSWSDWQDYVFWELGSDHYYKCYGCFHTEHVITGYDKVQVGTEKVQTGTEKVQIGTEQVKTGTKQVYDHKECTECGARG